jgi:CheY-like chemotaxis protein
VEDDEAIREELAAELGNDAELDISVANDGREALDLIATGRFWPDVILLDLMMPKLDGDTFLAALDAINGTRRIAIVVTTALPKERIPEAARRRARVILTKPFKLAAVAAAVRAALVD